jgi:hypothetical protein
MIEFHRNDSSWCAGNIMDELEAIAKPSGCLCEHVSFEYVGEAPAVEMEVHHDNDR